MIKITSSITLLCAALASAAEIINVRDHDITPGKDATLALNELIASVKGRSDVTLSFPKGRYLFYPENALEEHRAVSNHDNSLKRMAFPLFGHKGLTISGNGSDFVFHGRMSPVVVKGAEKITLQDFTINWARSFHDEYEVVARDVEKSTVRLKADPERYPYKIKHGQLFSQNYDWEDKMGSNIFFDPKTRAPIYNTPAHYVNFWTPHEARAAGKNLIDLKAKFRKEPPPIGSVLITYGTHPTSRLSQAIHLSNSKDIVLKDITIYEAGGMGVIAERTENIHLDGIKVTSLDDRLVSTRADATHFIGCKGLIKMENCLFEHMLDDATNVHGAYVKVVEPLGKNQLLCEISHFQQWGFTFAGEGDRVALLSRETILPFHETKVTSVKKLNERRFILTVDQLPENLPDTPLSVENLTWYPDFIMRNNIVRENRARSILITTKGKVLIENNSFSSQMHGILIEGDNKYWYESGAVKDIIIRNNTFVNSSFGHTDNYPLFIAPMLTKDQRLGEGHYHRNIRFTGNTLKSFNGLLAHATSVSGLEISNNTVEFSTDYPAVREKPTFDLHYCDAVRVQNNIFKGFSEPLPSHISKDSTNIVFKKNTGLAPTSVKK